MYFRIVSGEKSLKYPGKQAAQGGLHIRIRIAKAASFLLDVQDSAARFFQLKK
jgi:hypothetical protein